MKKVRFLLIAILLQFNLTAVKQMYAQHFGDCCTSIDITQSVPRCTNCYKSEAWLTKYRTSGYWIPNSDTPIKTIKVNWIICRKSDGTGGWQDTHQFRDQVALMFQKINLIYSQSLPKGYSLTCEPNYTHIADSRIRWELNEIIFINNTALHLTTSSFQVLDYLKIHHPSAFEAMNHIFTMPTNMNGVWGWYGDYNSEHAYVHTKYSMYSDWYVVWDDHIGHIAHEYGHAVGLHHTYDSEYKQINHYDFMDDIFGTCAQAGYCSPPPPTGYICYLDSSFWNSQPREYPLMSGRVLPRYISPKSMGRMHRALSFYDYTFLVDNNKPMHKYVKEKYSYHIPLTIYGNETWDFSIKMYQDIVVETGATLILTEEVLMPVAGKIIVKPGGKLIINDGTLRSAHSESWEGIEVWGNSSQHQFSYGNNQYYQGYVKLNNATISNARNAINLWKPGDYSKTGGIVIATNSSFINNRESIRALSYRNFHPVNGSEMDYIAIIKNCVFEVNDDYFGDYEFFKHVDLANVRGPQFLGCDFSLSPGAPNVAFENHGIAAYSAGFTVNAFCTSSTVPCTEYDRCKFAGFRYAISANPVGRTSRSFFVNKAEFENNIFGIQVSGIDNFIVVNSNFKVGSSTLPFCSFGIYMEESNGFAIEDNEFGKTPGTLCSNTSGIYAKTTNGIDDIYKNRFSNLTSGNYCEGFNYKDDYWTGLQFLCNQNTGNFADFYVKKLEDEGDAIQAMQGNSSLPAANTFSPNATWHFYNGGDYLVGYYYRNTGFEIPDVNKIYQVTREFVSTPPSNLCVSNYGTDDPREKIILSDQERLEQEYNFATASIDYANVKNIYERLTDGGSTENTLYDVSSATTSNMLAVKNDLLSSSPHLSEEVLRLLAQRTDVFPDIAVFDVLAANPDELKKTELIRFLEEKDNPLPGYMIDILRQVAEGSSYKTLLQLEMTKFSRNRIKSANTIIRSILNSETVDYTDLRNWLENLGGIEADKQIISSHMDEMNYAAASNLAQTLATKYNLQGEELADINAFNECLNIWIAVKTSGREFDELSEEELAILDNIIANDSARSARSFAKSIKTAYNSMPECECPEFDDNTGLKQGEVDFQKLAGDQGFLVTANPNPAKDWVSFDYTLPKDISSGVIEIRDLKGNLIDKLIINGTEGQIIWNAAAFQTGSYFYTAKAGKLALSGKIVIVK